LLAISYNEHLSEKDPLNEIVNPFSGKRYPNFPKTLHEVRGWNGEHLNVCEIEQGLIGCVVLEISSFMNFLECDPCLPRPETDQGIEQAIREIKGKVGLPRDNPKSATTIHAPNQSIDKTLHTTTFTGKSPTSSINKIRSGRVAKLLSSKQRLSRKPRRE
jgi:hypothetical protein